MAPACITLIWMIWMISPYSRTKHASVETHKKNRAAIILIHDHYLIQIPVPRPLALNRLASSLSDHRYGHQCNHPAGTPVCVLYFKSCHSLAQKVSAIGAICPTSQCLPCFLLHL